MIASERNSPEIYKIKNRTFGRWLAYLSLPPLTKSRFSLKNLLRAIQFPQEPHCCDRQSDIRSKMSGTGDPQKDRFKMLLSGGLIAPKATKPAYRCLPFFSGSTSKLGVDDDWGWNERQVLENQIINLGLQDKIKLLRSSLTSVTFIAKQICLSFHHCGRDRQTLSLKPWHMDYQPLALKWTE